MNSLGAYQIKFGIGRFDTQEERVARHARQNDRTLNTG